MGYTHYFDAKLTADVLSDIKKLVAASPVVLGDGHGEGSPLITEAKVQFNGDASADEDYETFTLTAQKRDDFTKTARKPYDIVVAAVLISVIVHNAGDVDSDGNHNEAEWKEALSFYQSVCGKLSDVQKSKVISSIG